MTIAGMVKSSLVDYPGLISCVLFVPGCNYNCFYCHNRSLLEEIHEVISPAKVERFLRSRIGLLDAVVITGGEPTLQQELIPYVKEIRQLGYRIKLDTNGSSPETVRQLLLEGLCDYFAVDYKAPAVRYEELCGAAAHAQPVRETIRLLLEYQAKFEVRTTVIPQLKAEDLIRMAKELPPLPRYVLNRYRKPERFLSCDQERVEEAPYSPEQIQALAEQIRFIQPNVVT